MVVRSIPTLLALTIVAACNTPPADTPSDASRAQPTIPARLLRDLGGPNSWSGDLPCADCAAISTSLTLAPDGTYRRQAAYRGTNGGGDTIMTDVGRWTQFDAGTRVTLRGSAEAPGEFAVLANGSLRLLDLEGHPISAALNYDLAAVAEPVEITTPARLVAAFTYYADAPSAVECGSGLQFPVDMSGEYLSLERAYSAAGLSGGTPMVVRLRAHLDERPRMDGEGTEPTLIVDSLLAADPADGCAALRAHDTIAAHEWRLAALHDADGPMALPADNRATFTWDRTEGRFSGNSGCNQYAAQGLLRGTTLAAGPALGTKIACEVPEAASVERRILVLLTTQPALRVSGDTLVFSEGPTDVAWFTKR